MKIPSFLLSLLLLVSSSSFLGGVQGESIAEVVEGRGELGTFTNLLRRTDLDDFLTCWLFCGARKFTVFAPSDEALSSLSTDFAEDDSFRLHLTQVLLHHMTRGVLSAGDVVDEGGNVEVGTLQGGTVVAMVGSNGDVTIDTATVVTPNLEADNGIVHVIDAPLMPDFLFESIYDVVSSKSNLSTLKAAIERAELVDVLDGLDGAFTLFAPTDTAFGKLPPGTLEALSVAELKDLLLYHVLPGVVPSADIEGPLSTALVGSSIEVGFGGSFWSPKLELNDGVRLGKLDILAANGIIHEVKQVLMPPPAGAAQDVTNDIIGVAQANGNFETLLSALNTAGLTATLQGEGPFTVFAPTDAAFDRLPSGSLNDLLADVQELTDVLTYHVLDGAVMRADLEEGVVKSKNGANLYVGRRFRTWLLNDATRIETYDIEATNGIIHVISNVLVPPPSIYKLVEETAFFARLQEAVDAAGLSTTLDEDGPFTLFAPLNFAFDRLEDDFGKVLEYPNLDQVLLYHLLDGNVFGGDLREGPVTTKQGSTFEVAFVSRFFGLFFRSVEVNGSATVGLTDIKCRNGIVHLLDEVLEIP